MIATLLFAILQDQPTATDISVAGHPYEAGKVLRLFTDDLTGGGITIRGKLDRRGYTGRVLVEVSLDAALTWQKAQGEDDWFFIYQPVGPVNIRLQVRVTKIEVPEPPPAPKIVLENIQFLVDGKPLQALPDNSYVYAGRVTVRGTVRNAGTGTVPNVQVDYEFDGEMTSLVAPADLGSRDFEAELRDFKNQNATVRILAMQVQEDQLLDSREFKFAPVKTGDGFQIRNPRVDGDYLAVEILAPPDSIHYNVTAKITGSDGGSSSSTISELHSGVWIPALIPMGNAAGTIDLEIGKDRFPGVAARTRFAAHGFTDPMTIQLGDLKFRVSPDPQATRDAFFGKGKLVLPTAIGGIDAVPANADVSIGPVKIDANNAIIEANNVVVNLGQVVEVLRLGALRVYLVQIVLNTAGARIVGGVTAGPVKFGTYLPIDVDGVKDLTEFHTTVGASSIDVLGLFTGTAGPIHVDFSSTWSQTGDASWKGLYIPSANLKMGQVDVTLEKVRIANTVDANIKAVFPSVQSGGFEIKNLQAECAMTSNVLGDWKVLGGELQTPASVKAGGAPAEFRLFGPNNRISTNRQLDLVIPRLDHNVKLTYGNKATVEWSSMAVDLSGMRSLPRDWRSSGWQGIQIQANIIYEGRGYRTPLVMTPAGLFGEFVIGGTEKTYEGLKCYIKPTLVRLSEKGVEVIPAEVVIELPQGVAVGEGHVGPNMIPTGRMIVLQKGSAEFAAASPDFAMTIQGRYTFAFSGIRALAVDPVFDLSATVQAAGDAPAIKGLSLGTGTINIPMGKDSQIPYSGIYIGKNGATGSFPVAGVSIKPEGWNGLSIAIDEARVVIEANALKEISIKGKANLSNPLVVQPLSIPFSTAGLKKASSGDYEFNGTGSFTESQELILQGNAKLHHLTEIIFHFEPNAPPPPWWKRTAQKWSGIMIKSGKLDLPPPLGGKAIDLINIPITKEGIHGRVTSDTQILINEPSGAKQVSINVSSVEIQFNKNRIGSASMSGEVRFQVGDTPFNVRVDKLLVQSSPDGKDFGFLAESLDTDGTPFSLGGVDLSLSAIGLDLSNFSNLSGVQGDASWKGIKINNGSLRMPLKIASSTGTPAGFEMSGVTYPFGGQLSGRFQLKSPVRVNLLQPAGMEFHLDYGSVTLLNGVMTQSSLNGKMVLPDKFKTDGQRAQVNFSNLSFTASGDIYIQNLPLSKTTFGGYAIVSNKVTIDLSDTQSPGPRAPAWKGVHFETADIYVTALGDLFKVDAIDFAYGPDGFSGIVNKTSQDYKAKFGGFGIALNRVTLTFQNSRVTAAGFSGSLTIPKYSTIKIDLNADDTGITSATAQTDKGISMTGFGLTLNLKKLVIVRQGTAGYLEIDGSMTLLQAGLNCPGIQVEGLRITSEGEVSLKSAWVNLGNTCTAKLGTFTIAVTQIGFGTEGSLKWFGISGEMSLVEVMSAKASALKIYINSSGNFAKLTCDEISVEMETGAVKISGKARIFDDANDGKGFEGSLKLEFKALKFTIDGYLLLGSKADYTYFRVHVQVTLPSGIALGSTGISIYGFNGGVAYNMKFDPQTTKYSPLKGGWAVSAGVTLGSSADKGASWNGDFKLTIAMSAGNFSVTLEGELWLMCKTDARNDNAKGKFTISVTNTYLYGSASFTVTRQPIVTVSGNLEFYFPWSGKDWYLRIGTPQNRLTVRMLNSVTGTGYLMVDGSSLRVGFSVSYSFSLDWSVIRGDFGFAFGADATIYFDPTRIDASIWVSGYASISVKIVRKWYNLASITASGTLNLKAPNPTQISGTLSFSFKILGIRYNKSKSFTKTF